MRSWIAGAAVATHELGGALFWSDLPRCLAGRWVASLAQQAAYLHLRWLPERCCRKVPHQGNDVTSRGSAARACGGAFPDSGPTAVTDQSGRLPTEDELPRHARHLVDTRCSRPICCRVSAQPHVDERVAEARDSGATAIFAGPSSRRGDAGGKLRMRCYHGGDDPRGIPANIILGGPRDEHRRERHLLAADPSTPRSV